MFFLALYSITLVGATVWKLRSYCCRHDNSDNDDNDNNNIKTKLETTPSFLDVNYLAQSRCCLISDSFENIKHEKANTKKFYNADKLDPLSVLKSRNTCTACDHNSDIRFAAFKKSEQPCESPVVRKDLPSIIMHPVNVQESKHLSFSSVKPAISLPPSDAVSEFGSVNTPLFATTKTGKLCIAPPVTVPVATNRRPGRKRSRRNKTDKSHLVYDQNISGRRLSTKLNMQ